MKKLKRNALVLSSTYLVGWFVGFLCCYSLYDLEKGQAERKAARARNRTRSMQRAGYGYRPRVS